MFQTFMLFNRMCYLMAVVFFFKHFKTYFTRNSDPPSLIFFGALTLTNQMQIRYATHKNWSHHPPHLRSFTTNIESSTIFQSHGGTPKAINIFHHFTRPGDESFLRRCGDQREDLLRHWRC